MKYTLGIDLGGTNVRVAKVSESGKIAEIKVASSHGEEDYESVMNHLFLLIDSFDLSDVESIGIGAPGVIDYKNRILISSNIVSLKHVPFVDILKERYHREAYLENDANCAGLAEALVGAGAGHSIVYYVTHSTGIGGALIIDGKLIRGATGDTGEIGSSIIYQEPKTKFEWIHGGPQIAELGKERLGTATTKEVFDLAREKNPVAMEIVDKMANDMGHLLSYLYYLVNPDCIVLGGGVSKSLDVYYDALRSYYDYYAGRRSPDTYILKAKLEEPGIIGAALLKE